jgi:hypothetical protein
MHSFFKQYTTGFLAAEPPKRNTTNQTIKLVIVKTPFASSKPRVAKPQTDEANLEHMLLKIEESINSLVIQLNYTRWICDEHAVLDKVDELQNYIQLAKKNSDIDFKMDMIDKIHKKVLEIYAYKVYSHDVQQIVEHITNMSFEIMEHVSRQT